TITKLLTSARGACDWPARTLMDKLVQIIGKLLIGPSAEKVTDAVKFIVQSIKKPASASSARALEINGFACLLSLLRSLKKARYMIRYSCIRILFKLAHESGICADQLAW